MQGKRQYIRKINRKARGMGETRKQGEGFPPPPQALAENRWAGGRGALRLHPKYAPQGQKKGAHNECSDWASHAHHRSLWRGGHPCSSVVFCNSNHSRLKRLSEPSTVRKTSRLKQAPINLDQLLLQCSKNRTRACLVHSCIPGA